MAGGSSGLAVCRRHRADTAGPQMAGVDRHAVTLDPHPAVIDHVRRQGVHLDVRGRDVRRAAYEHPGLADRGGDRPGPGGDVLQAGQRRLVGPVGGVVADRGGLGGQIDVHVILEVLAHSGQVVDDRNAELA